MQYNLFDRAVVILLRKSDNTANLFNSINLA